MADHIRVYAGYLWELCTTPILPFEFVSVANQFKARIAELAAAGSSVGVGSLLEHAAALEIVARELDEVAKVWNGRYRADPAFDNGSADLLNTCIKRLKSRPSADRQHGQRDLRPRHVLVYASVDRDPLPV